jgi:hypothetical protein
VLEAATDLEKVLKRVGNSDLSRSRRDSPAVRVAAVRLVAATHGARRATRALDPSEISSYWNLLDRLDKKACAESGVFGTHSGEADVLHELSHWTFSTVRFSVRPTTNESIRIREKPPRPGPPPKETSERTSALKDRDFGAGNRQSTAPPGRPKITYGPARRNEIQYGTLPSSGVTDDQVITDERAKQSLAVRMSPPPRSCTH